MRRKEKNPQIFSASFPKAIDFLGNMAYNNTRSRLVVANDYRQKGLLLFLCFQLLSLRKNASFVCEVPQEVLTF